MSSQRRVGIVHRERNAAVLSPAPRVGSLRQRVLLVILALLAIAPVLALVVTALFPSAPYPQFRFAEASGRTVQSLLTSSALWNALGTSLMLALATGLCSTLLAFAAARALDRATIRVRRIAAAAAFLPVIAPPIALGIGVQVFALRAGVGGSFGGVLAAHIVPATGYLTLFLLGAFTAYDHALDDIARSLGASPLVVLRRVTIPVLRGPIVQSIGLGALVSWGQLALTLLVGGGIVRSLPVELLSFVQAGDDRLGAAAALLLTVPPALALGVAQSGARRTGVIA